MPSRLPEIVLPSPPASVVTTPRGVILRIRLFPESTTYTSPEASTEMPLGLLNVALVPRPSVLPALVLPSPPASVVTAPLGVILRIRLLPESTTYTLPAVSTATAVGLSNVALVPRPSALPALVPPLPPASVVTVPPGVIFRTRLFPESTTYTSPAESTATAVGLLNVALVPMPFALPASVLPPPPASVVTVPLGAIMRITLLAESAT